MSDLHFKFRDRTTAATREKIVERLEQLGASVRPMFPDEQDEELSGLYRLECDSGAKRSVLAELKNEDAIEFAEPAVKRKLIR